MSYDQETFRPTVSSTLKLCEEVAINRHLSLTIYFIISVILLYIIIALIVYAFRNNFLFKCEGRYNVYVLYMAFMQLNNWFLKSVILCN